MAAVLAVAVVLAVFLGALSVLGPDGCGTVDECLANAPESAALVSTRGGAVLDATVVARDDGSAALVTLRGHTSWTVATRSTVAPRLVAAGDLSGDGVTDYVLGLARPVSPARRCGGRTVFDTSLLVVDGRTGRGSSPVRPQADICWQKPTFSYPTQQWDASTAHIGDYSNAAKGQELVLTPYYAKTGTVWNLAQTGRWERVRTRARAGFAFPSTAAFDRAYDATNPTPCASPTPGTPCFVENSHVANAAMLPGTGARGLFVLTSARAVIYRPDLTPTADTAWYPGGTTSNGGRNYGLVDAYRAGRKTYVDLLGGCSVLTMSRAMQPGAAPTGGDANCGIVRHVERFSVDGTRITGHGSLYYGYAPTQGPYEGRLEYPGHPRAPLVGPGSSATVYNLLQGGTWSAQILNGPMATQPVSLPAWFVWDTIRVHGDALLLATRVRPGDPVAPWSFDVLRYSGSGVRSLQHVDGRVPALVRSPPSATMGTTDDGVFGAALRGDRLLVVSSDGSRSFAPIGAARR
jgi:hypothetical protein